MKRRIISAFLVAVSCLCLAYGTTDMNVVNAGVVTKDLHSEFGTPAMIVSDVNLYKSKKLTGKPSANIKKGTVIRVLGENSINYNGIILFFDKKSVITGGELTNYVVKHAKRFDKKVTTTKYTKLYDIKTYKEIASVGPETSFLITGEDSEFYKVTFDEQEALLYKNDADEELYVKVTSYNDISQSLADVYDQLKQLTASMGMDTSQFNYDAEVSNTIVKYALQFVGNPYVWGGNSLIDGCDCSGFTKLVYGHFGVELPRCSSDQALRGTAIDQSQIQPGDLLFFQRGSRIGHVAMYTGNGMIVHAKGTRYGIVHEKLKERPAVCRRFIMEGNNSE